MNVPRFVVTAVATLLCGAALLSARQIVVSTSGDMSRSAAPAPKGTGLVMGRVVDGDSAAPIPDVTVSLSSLAPSASWEPVVTDAQGRFVIRDLPKAMLRFYVVKPGYVPGEYTKRLPVGLNDVGQLLGLGDDERVGDVTIKIWKYAVIDGTVTDESGDPVVGITVRALPRRVVAGRTMFAMESGALPFGAFTAQTDDRGVYRLSQLPPGDYVVALPAIVTSAAKSERVPAGSPLDAVSSSNTGLMSWFGGGSSGGVAVPQLEGGDDHFGIVDRRVPSSIGAPGIAGLTAEGRLLVYETQFFPGTPALSRATPVTLGSGANRSGVDFRLRPMPAFKIAGTASRPDRPAAGLTMRLVNAEMSATSADPEVAITTADANGRFVFLGVTPGQYAIRALDVPRPARTPGPASTSTVQTGGSGSSMMIMSSGPAGIPDAPTFWADAPVSVGDRDVAGISVMVHPGFRISGRVEFDGTAERPDLSSRAPSVTVARADGLRSSNLTIQSGRIDPDGRFMTYGQVPGQYVLQVSAPLPWHLAGIFAGARDVSVLPLDLTSKDVDGVVIKFTDRAPASISGTVTDGRGQPDENASVIVFPADRQLWSNGGPSPRNLRAVGTGRGGRFSAENLPAGDYLVAAVPHLIVTWADTKSLDALAGAASHVTLREFESTSLSLRLGPARAETDEPVIEHGPFVPDEPQTVRDAPASATTGTGRVAGVVLVDGKASAPAARAHVTLFGPAAIGNRTIITTDDGRFDFGQLPAGRFSLVADKAAYLTTNYGEKKINGQGTAIMLADGQQVTGLTLALHKGSVITGIVRDERGSPMPDAQVAAMQYRTNANGERRLGNTGPTSSTRTDDRGVYRIFGLAPAEYYVSATPSYTAPNAHPVSAADIQFAQQALQRGAASNSAGPGAATSTAASTSPIDRHVTVRYAPVLYPGVMTVDGAQPIVLAVGEERTAIDFSVRLVPTVKIEGAVTNSAGPLPSNVDVRLLTTGETVPTSGIFSLDGLLPLRPGADGRFAFQGVAPGSYVVAAMTQSATGRGGVAASSGLWGTASIEVNGVDLSNITVSLQPGMTVSGKLRFNATTLTPPADLTTVRLSLSPVLTSGQVAMGQNSVSPGPDGSFTFAGLTPGNYNLRATLTGGWVMTAVSAGGRDALDGPFEIKPGESVADASITMSDRTAEVSGVFQDASGRPASDYYIILMPADSSKWKSPNRRVVSVKPSSDGRFTFRNLLAGDWLIGATTDYEIGATADPAFLAEIAKAAVKVPVADGEKKVQDIRIGKG